MRTGRQLCRGGEGVWERHQPQRGLLGGPSEGILVFLKTRVWRERKFTFAFSFILCDPLNQPSRREGGLQGDRAWSSPIPLPRWACHSHGPRAQAARRSQVSPTRQDVSVT